MVNPRDIPTPGPLGPLRDMRRETETLRRLQAETRATALTAQELPPPYVPPPPPPAPPWGMRVRRLNALVSIPNNAWTLVTWPVMAESHGTAVAAPNAADLQAAVNGIYFHSCRVHFVAGGADALREMRLMHNGVRVDLASQRTAGGITLTLARPLWMNAGDILGVEVYQASGGPLNLWSEGPHSQHSLILINPV